ncbi:LysR substrate-binding domain-containing protein [Klebsiella aerogenes]|uniref:LysR substrate-binding domain-containing protein n=1 Tax=Klebsiella aerogenes TaxID=548 RepID=UPI003754722A
MRTISLYINKLINHSRHITTMLGMVDAGLGIAAIPAMALPAYAHHALASIPLVEPEVKRQVGLIKKAGRALPPLAAELEKAITDFYHPTA